VIRQSHRIGDVRPGVERALDTDLCAPTPVRPPRDGQQRAAEDEYLRQHASPGQSPPDLMLAAVHYLLARQPHHPLARHYPTLTPRPRSRRRLPGFRTFCLDHRDELSRLVASRRVQTNEVRRCCYLLPALIAAAPVAAAVAIFHTAFLAHLPALERERFEHLAVVLSTARPVYWIQAEPRGDPAEPRLRLTVCENGSVTREWPLGHYQPHGTWLHWLAGSVPAPAGQAQPR
jgi:hypothetical protein